MKKLLIFIFLLLTASCSVKTSFVVPENTTLTIAGKEVPNEELKEYKRTPFFWNKAGGINYSLEKDGKIVEEGKLKSKFRVVSIFWPPAAAIYWPMGFAGTNYDLVEHNFPMVQTENDPKYVQFKKDLAQLNLDYKEGKLTKPEYKAGKRRLNTQASK
ncbi:MAG: hypothetical protein QNL04_12220 [SAR324 cluster bacterium]|nr:hypothetical protein [SAR324 cluster bacterium]